jgi:hypothetical protein
VTLFDPDELPPPPTKDWLGFNRCNAKGPWMQWPEPRRRARCSQPMGHRPPHIEHRGRTAEVRALWTDPPPKADPVAGMHSREGGDAPTD